MLSVLEITKLCEDVNVLTVMLIINTIITIAKVAVPLILIIWASYDIYQGYVIDAGKDSKKVNQVVLKRLLAAIIVFFVPTFIKIIIDVSPGLKDEVGQCVNITKEVLDELKSKSEETCIANGGIWNEVENKCYPQNNK